MRKILLAASVLAAISCAPSAFAGQIDAGLSAGTLGYGPQVGWTIVPNKFDARLNYGYLNYNYNTTSDGVHYDGQLKLSNLGLLGDWHPWGGSFRLTGGVFYNDNRFALTGQSAGGTITINGVTYTTAEAGTVKAKVTFNSVNPYLGFGWGDGGSGAGLHFTSDFGVMYQGSPKVNLTATGAAANPALAANVQAAQGKLQSDLNSFQWYPVIQLGVVYRF